MKILFSENFFLDNYFHYVIEDDFSREILTSYKDINHNNAIK